MPKLSLPIVKRFRAPKDGEYIVDGVQKELKAGEYYTEKGELDVYVDTSFKSHLKWEELFQEKYKTDLSSFTAVIQDAIFNSKDRGMSRFTDVLRVLYCYIDSLDLPTFSAFVGILEPENAKEILEAVVEVLSAVNSPAAKK